MLRGVRTWYIERRGRSAVVVAWIGTRLLILALYALVENFIHGDVAYYHRKIEAMFDVGIERTLNEYPTPVAWILTLPYAVGLGTTLGYIVAFIAFMMLLDAAFTYVLWRASGRTHDSSIDFWLLFVLLIGPLSYMRFDIIPAVLAGGALLAARRIPWVTGALTGLGAAIKLWPALLIPAFLSHRPDRKAAGAAFVGVGFGLALISLVAGGWSRLVSPLTWQSGRGLQIESIWATPLMVARAIQPESWMVDMSKFQAYEIFGPGVSALLAVSDVATVAGLVVIVVLFVRAFRAGDPSPIAVGLLVLAVVAIMTVTNKTLSPQYLLWLGGPMAALLVLAKSTRSPQEIRVVTRTAVFLLLLAGLTQLVYPLLYDGLLGRRGQAMLALSTTVTAVRNLALLVFSVAIVRLAWRDLADWPAPRVSAHL